MKEKTCNVSIGFEEISLPPIKDILVMGKNSPHGKYGIRECFNLLSPNKFELIEINNEIVQAIVVSKNILKRMSIEKIIEILEENVFPYILDVEIVRVDFNVKILIDNIKKDLLL